ncbi:Calcineurin binding protein [Coniochaeta hoffmannii]|uniref:Calcineurin binding protein n=1 Tax=Coniochaeta hoffmannii TaxID=91930 RepID=A0AA38S8X8_9PEZI|nr:Calcineurin binding protein [Coniochaeta hoffmannii]
MGQHEQQAAARPSPPSRTSTTSSRKSTLTLDLSSLPPLTQPAVPSNTLIFTNLQNTEIFRPDNLQTIRDLISSTVPIHSWAPLKSFRRIIVSFFDEQAAIQIRSIWDGEAILGERCRVYFGAPTPTDLAEKDHHLALPDAGKLFFISPPPSPPHGWEMKLEDAPNKMVHADDLAEALAKLRHQAGGPVSPTSPVDSTMGGVDAPSPRASGQRSRSSTLIFHPEEHGGSPGLPCIAVDDMTDEPEELSSPVVPKPIQAHTARPPVELMHHA